MLNRRFLLMLFFCMSLCMPTSFAMNVPPDRAAAPVTSQVPSRTPSISYRVVENTLKAVEVNVVWSNERVDKCILKADMGTVSIEMTDNISFFWDGKLEQATIDWGNFLTLRYKPYCSADDLATGKGYSDTITLQYYDAYGLVLSKDIILIQSDGKTLFRTVKLDAE